MTTEEIITTYETLKASLDKAYGDYKSLEKAREEERPKIHRFPDIEMQEAWETLCKASDAFLSFKAHKWS